MQFHIWKGQLRWTCYFIVSVLGFTTGHARGAEEADPPAELRARPVFTAADVAMIVERCNAGPRGGMVRVVECNGAYGYSTIQSAVDAAADGDVIVVLPNDCTEDGRWHEQVNFLGKSLRIQSANPEDPAVVEATLVDGGESGRAFRIEGLPQSPIGTAELDGLTIMGRFCVFAWNMSFIGTRLRLIDSSFRGITLTGNVIPHPVSIVRNCTFSTCLQAIDAPAHMLSIESCIFDGNSAAVFANYCKVLRSTFRNQIHYAIYAGGEHEIDHCSFISNRGPFIIKNTGCFVPNYLRITNSLFVGNRTIDSNKVCGNAYFAHCTFVGNSGSSGTVYAKNNGPEVAHCVFKDNRSNVQHVGLRPNFGGDLINISHCVIPGLPIALANSNNIDADPLFVDAGHWNDNGTPTNLMDDFFTPGDYRLLPDSPCIDAGDPAFTPADGETDLDGNPRLRGCRVDIGAYEAPRGEPGSGDFNGDAIVSLGDVAAFVSALLNTDNGDCVADLNADGTADGADLPLFLSELF